MQPKWNDSQPIYVQLRDHAVAMILDGVLDDGDPLPSVRKVAADFRLNPITVSKAYQTLVDDELVERRRGLGMFVRTGAKKALLEAERKKFLNREWPLLLKKIERLGLHPEDLVAKLGTGPKNGQEQGEPDV
ncbi:MAG: GntR family transcriptional regulator [Xanthomonadales bacterium]|nr:GntR family transcriptional regulator [Xanthomonadales bacterium]